MKYRLYIRVEGSEAELRALNEVLRDKVPGSVNQRRQAAGALGTGSLFYWTSQEVRPALNHLAVALFDLVQSFADSIKETGACGRDADITAVVVCEYSENDDPVGFFFDKKLIQLLASIGATVDIDAVHDMTNA